jgi:hypothetical protein
MAHTATRLFPLEDVLWFAEISGDPNPVHIDPEFAARTYPGAVVAHGIHLVLWALETLPPEDTAALSDGLKVVFRRPVIVGEEVQAEATKPGVIGLQVGGAPTATIRLKAGNPPERWKPGAPAHRPSHPPVLQGAPDSLADVTGALRLPDNNEALLAALPNLGRRLGAQALQGLSGIAPVSGSVLGGVTTEISVQFSDDSPGENLEYRLLSHFPALQRFELAFWGYGVIGKVAAMVGGGTSRET